MKAHIVYTHTKMLNTLIVDVFSSKLLAEKCRDAAAAGEFRSVESHLIQQQFPPKPSKHWSDRKRWKKKEPRP